jgi:hypothetical protein
MFELPKIKCVLCSSQAEQLATQGATRHVLCNKCGDYIIIFPVERLLKSNNYDNIKHFLSGQVYENMIDEKSPFIIGYEQLAEPFELPLMQKLYKLSKYLWFQTKKYGYGNDNLHIIPEQAYCKDMRELVYLAGILREKNVIAGGISSVGSVDFVAYGCTIHLTPNAILAYEEGINDIETFRRVFMGNNDNGDNIKVSLENASNNQITIALQGSKAEAIQNNNSAIAEIAKLLDELKAQIPNDLPANTKEQITDSISAINAEIKNQKPNKSIINTLLLGLRGLVNTAGFAASVAAILHYISTL